MTNKQFSISIAKKAGQVIRKNFGLGMKRIMKKDGSPVTKTDLAINKMVVEQVKKYFPKHGVLGEEQSNIIANSEYTWVCDPVDGTIPFSHGMPTCMFSLGLTHHGESILGVAYDPFLDRMFFAEKGKGAYVNNKKIHVSNKNKLQGSYISVGVWPNMPYPTPNIIETLVFKKKTDFFAMSSVVYNACLLAAGELEGVILGASTAHDAAAIDIIVKEAGGKTSNYDGKDQRYDRPIKGWIGSNGILHKELLGLVKNNLK